LRILLWFFGSLVLWFFGSLVLWFFGSLVLWFFGVLVFWLWFRSSGLVFEFFNRSLSGYASFTDQ